MTANKNGLLYETLTDLSDKYTVISSYNSYKYIKFLNYEEVFIQANKRGLFDYMKNKINNKISPANGCKLPDESFVQERTKTIIIIEKKFQKCPGSVCEKIQTPSFKIWHYNRLFPNYKIKYIYCLSDWFKTNCPEELEYLNYINVPIFFGCDENYKLEIINYIMSV